MAKKKPEASGMFELMEQLATRSRRQHDAIKCIDGYGMTPTATARQMGLPEHAVMTERTAGFKTMLQILGGGAYEAWIDALRNESTPENDGEDLEEVETE